MAFRSTTASSSLLDQWRHTPPPETWRGWLMTLVITAGAFILRCWHIGQPSAIMFDETVYAKDAYSMYQFGYQGTWTWGAAIALLIGLLRWAIRRDQRFGIIVMAVAAIWLPWVLTTNHRVFAYYAAPMIPFMAIGLAMLLGGLVNPVPTSWRELSRARQVSLTIGAVYLLAVVGDFCFNYPIYTGHVLTTAHWMWRMWLPGWI